MTSSQKFSVARRRLAFCLNHVIYFPNLSKSFPIGDNIWTIWFTKFWLLLLSYEHISIFEITAGISGGLTVAIIAMLPQIIAPTSGLVGAIVLAIIPTE